jgi:1,4-dihydroxy-2-naphthoate octaprenyltransferase
MTRWFIGLWQSTRPKTWIATLSPVLIGGAWASQTLPLNWPIYIITLTSALFIQIGTNLANDFFDHHHGSDTKNRLGPQRGIHNGSLTLTQLKVATIMSFVIAGLLGLYLMMTGGAVIMWIGIFSIISGILYTGGPLPLGYIGLGDIFAGIFFGPVAVLGTIYLQLGIVA